MAPLTSKGSLLEPLGFDVEEVPGWASNATSTEPQAHLLYLRVSAVAGDAFRLQEDSLQVGDIIVNFFGSDSDSIRSRDAFVEACCRLPFCYVGVFRKSTAAVAVQSADAVTDEAVATTETKDATTGGAAETIVESEHNLDTAGTTDAGTEVTETAKAAEEAVDRAMAKAEAAVQAKPEAETAAKAKAEDEAATEAKVEGQATVQAKAELEAGAKAKPEQEATAKAEVGTEAAAKAKATAETEAAAKAKAKEEPKPKVEQEAAAKKEEATETNTHSAAQEMLKAILSGNANAVRSLLVAKADHNQQLPASDHTKEGSPLSVAIESGTPGIIRLFVDGTTVNQRNEESSATPLYVAVQMKSSSAVSTLLEIKADPNQTIADGSAPAELAVFTGLLPELKMLLQHKVDASHVRKSDGNSLLMMAAFKGEFEMASELVKAKADIHHVNDSDHTMRDILSAVHQKHPFEVGLPDEEAMIVAAENDDVDMLTRCLECGTDIDERNEEGLTALALASYFGCMACLKVLMQHKADPNVVGEDGSTPLLVAVFEGHDDVVESLVKTYGDALDQTVALTQNTTALYLACQENRPGMVKVLLEHSKVALEICRDDGVSPLYVSAHEGHNECLELLIAAKANVNSTNMAGTAPLYIAAQKGNLEAAELLLAAGANANAKNHAGATPLLAATFACNSDLVRLLLAHGAEADITTTQNRNTPKMLAAKYLDIDILGQLLLHGASLNFRNAANDCVDDILRIKHGLTVQHVALHCLARHPELENLATIDGKDARTIEKLFDEIDTDRSDSISKSELVAALERWGMKSKYGSEFRKFVTTEFDRVDEDGDGEILLEEFETCYARFHLMFRSNDAGSSAESVMELLKAEFEPSVPAWMRAASVKATSAIWAAHQHSKVLARAAGSENVFSYFVKRSHLKTPDSLLDLMGFDVEEVDGWIQPDEKSSSRASIGDKAVNEAQDDLAAGNDSSMRAPIKGVTYLRLTDVSESLQRGCQDSLQEGDIILSYFGRDDHDALRSRAAFLETCHLAPVCFLEVFRHPKRQTSAQTQLRKDGSSSSNEASRSPESQAEFVQPETAAPKTAAELQAEAESMLKAILSGNANAVRSLLVAKADHNQQLPASDHTKEGSPLSVAIETGTPGIIRLFVDETTVNQRDSVSGATPLYAALQAKASAAISTLLEIKADPNQTIADGSAPAELAVFTGLLPELKMLLQHKVDASHVRKSDGNSLLMMAAFKGEFEMASELVKAKADIYHVNDSDHTMRDILSAVHQKHPFEVGLPDEEAMIVAAENDDVDMLTRCLECGTDIDERNEEGLTALALASYFGCMACLKVLMQHKADPNVVGEDGSTPLLVAVFEGHDDVVESLVKTYGDALDQTVALTQNTTALYLACQENRPGMVKVLLEHSKVALEICRDDGVSPLYVSAHEGHNECLLHLLAAKSAANTQNNSGTAPLYIAAQKGFVDTCSHLLSAKADVNAENGGASTAILAAVYSCNLDLVKLLLQHGATLDASTNLHSNTAPLLAAKSLDVDILGQLLEYGGSLNFRNQLGQTVDDVLRTVHGVSVVDVAFHCLGRHPQLENLTSSEGKDAKSIRKLFDAIDTDQSQSISKRELTNALEKWGLKSKYGQDFRKFATEEFDRLDEDRDGEIMLAEFEACYARFNLMFRSSTLIAGNTDPTETIALLKADFEPMVPAWMRAKSVRATSLLWAAHQTTTHQKVVALPDGWYSYICPRLKEGNGTLAACMGFDVEEVEGWASTPNLDVDDGDGGAKDATAPLAVPVVGRKYLRVSFVSRSERQRSNDHLEVGDVLMGFFGLTDHEVLQSRTALADVSCKIPLCFFQIYRQPAK